MPTVGRQGALGPHDHDSSEAEALLYDTRLSTSDDASSVSTASMGARHETPWSVQKPTANAPDGGVELTRDDHQDSDSAQLRAQGHEAALQRSFSPLAALGLGFRYTFVFVLLMLMEQVRGLICSA